MPVATGDEKGRKKNENIQINVATLKDINFLLSIARTWPALGLVCLAAIEVLATNHGELECDCVAYTINISLLIA
jgi:hypothetical protein